MEENDLLQKLCIDALYEKYKKKGSAVFRKATERLIEEIEAIQEDNTASYYLEAYNFIHDNGLKPHQYSLRGTGAGVLVCHLLGLTDADPLDNELPLYYEFFLNHKPNFEFIIAENTRIQYESEYIKANPNKQLELISSLAEKTGGYPKAEDLCSKELWDFVTSEGSIIKWALVPYSNAYFLYLLNYLQPKTPYKLYKVKALANGTGTWINNGDQLYTNGIILKDLIATTDDVFEILLDERSGLSAEESFVIADSINTQRKDMAAIREHLLRNGIAEWCVDCIGKIEYAPSRSHIVEQMINDFVTLFFMYRYPHQYFQECLKIFASESFKSKVAHYKNHIEYLAWDLYSDNNSCNGDSLAYFAFMELQKYKQEEK